MKPKYNNFFKQFEIFLYFAGFLKPFWKIELCVIILSQVVVLLGLVNPYLTKLIIDNAFQKRNLTLFLIITLAIVIVFLLKGFANSIVTYYSQTVQERVNFTINSKTVSKLYSLDLDFFRNSSSSGNLYKIFFDIDMVASLVTDVVRKTLNVVPTFIFTFAIVLYLNWQMALIVFFLGFFYYFHSKFFTEKRKSIVKEQIEQKQRIFSRLNEVLQKIYLVKAACKEREEEENHINELSKSINIFFKSVKLQIASSATSQLIQSGIVGILTIYGGYSIIKGEMTLGTFTSIMVYLSRVANFHNEIGGLFQRIVIGLVSSERLKDIFAVNTRVVKTDQTMGALNFNPETILEDVSFSYDKKSPLIRNFNMHIRMGEWVALKGPSGCGKTTIINLILGLYSPDEGDISIGGISTRGIDFEFMLKNISIAPQEPFLWNTTIRNNLLYFNKSATCRDLESILTDVKLLDVVSKLPKGLDSEIGDDAGRFSVGQKQRLSLARALIGNPRFLIFDEALSSVDIETSNFILQNVKNKKPDLTVLIVSHNPKDLDFCDRVVTL